MRSSILSSILLLLGAFPSIVLAEEKARRAADSAKTERLRAAREAREVAETDERAAARPAPARVRRKAASKTP